MAFYITKTDSKIRVTGYNTSGQLGVDDTVSKTNVMATVNFQAKQVSCYYNHALMLMEDGTIMGSGSNSNMQISKSLPTNTLITTPVAIPTPVSGDKIVQICACGNSSAFLTSDGDVYAWGYNGSAGGLLGFSASSCISGTYNMDMTKIPGVPEKIVYVELCADSIFLVGESGKVYASGYNSGGKLGLGDSITRTAITEITSISNVKKVASSYGSTIFLLNNGDVYAVGQNYLGQLGLGTSNVSYLSPTKIPLSGVVDISMSKEEAAMSVFVMSDGTAYKCGKGFESDYTTPCVFYTPTAIHLSNVKYAFSGHYGISYIDNLGDVYVEGDKCEYGLDGKFNGTYIVYPVRMADYYTSFDTMGYIENQYYYTITTTVYNIPTGFLMYVDPLEIYTSGQDSNFVLNLKSDNDTTNPDNLIKYKVVSQTWSNFVNNNGVKTELVPYQSTYQFYDKIEFSKPIENEKSIITVFIESQSGNNSITVRLYDRYLNLNNQIVE